MSAWKRAALAAVVLALTAPAPATAARFAVGLERGASPTSVAKRAKEMSGGTVSVLAPFALTLETKRAAGVAQIRGVAYVERLNRSRRLAFVPTDPLAKRQWYLDAVKAFTYWPQLPPVRPPVLVAVIDSGVDASHPELQNRIEDARSFVDDFPRRDSQGHGTFVAGLIAAETNNAQGIAAIGFPVRLLVAKVVRADGTISPEAEAKAIRWAVDAGAQVINLSLGGTRDPLQPARDTFSQLEASAIDFAVEKGVVVVAAVGNGDQAPSLPWTHANYPAALPHVIGVSALARDGSVPSFSNRDPIYNDLAAPGQDVISTLPRALTEARPLCVEQAYSACGPREFKRGEGTSFAAPQVAAAAAVMLSEQPTLRPEQISVLLRRSAVDVTPLTGCPSCWTGHDSHSGWGRLDVEAAVRATHEELLPRMDQFEPNDEAGHRAATLGKRRRVLRLQATLDYWDDRADVYRVWLRRGQRMSAFVKGLSALEAQLLLWRPRTKVVQRRIPATTRPLRQSSGIGFSQRLKPYVAGATGWHYLEVQLPVPGSGSYALTIRR